MYKISKSFAFEASHVLPKHDGKCSRLHGHSYTMTLVCRGPTLETRGPKTGMLLDYTTLAMQGNILVVNFLDHYHLNDSLGMDDPTSENIARWVYDRVKPMIPSLYCVKIAETCTCECEYCPEDAWQ